MTDNIFNTTLFALITAIAIAAATLDVQAGAPALTAEAQTAQPVVIATAQEVITLSAVTVIGHRTSQAAVATQSADAQSAGVTIAAVSDH